MSGICDSHIHIFDPRFPAPHQSPEAFYGSARSA
jgi:hypothetical protein